VEIYEKISSHMSKQEEKDVCLYCTMAVGAAIGMFDVRSAAAFQCIGCAGGPKGGSYKNPFLSLYFFTNTNST
jgi:hypothetical protein